jgi:hypothetical protein
MDDEFFYYLVGEPGTEFVNFPDMAIDLSDYEVCLSDMTFSPGGWPNVRDGGNSLTLKLGHSQVDLRIKAKHYESSWELAVALQRVVGPAGGAFGGFDISKTEQEAQTAEDEVYSVFKKDQQEVIKTLKYSASNDLQIKFCPELAFMLGVNDRLYTANPWISSGWSSEQMDIRRNTLVRLWVFADFIVPTIIGPMKSPLLRFVPVAAGTSELIHSAFVTNDYRPCLRKRFNCLRMWISERCNSCANLELFGTVVFCLHFRKIQ